MSETPTGIPIADCPECHEVHPWGRRHCDTCGKASLFIYSDGSCLTCPTREATA